MKSGTSLFTIKGYNAVVIKTEGDLIFLEEKYPVTVSYDSGTKTENIIRTTTNIYKQEDMGILLFFSKKDIENHQKLIVDSNRYSNKKEIIEYFKNKSNKTLELIKKDQPFGRIIDDQERNAIINSYYDLKTNYIDDFNFFNLSNENISCFARIDLDTHYFRRYYEEYLDNHYYDRIYVSRESGYKDLKNGVHIVNWRAPIAKFYYDLTITNWTSDAYVDVVNKTLLMNNNNVYEYTLLLKRNFPSISPLKFDNLYIANDEFFSVGSYDPFLMEVFLEKKSNHKITDIIKSIQSNQNAIIRERFNSNIIVQGCAGSGKTMILLHRISYLKYNNLLPNSNFLKVITPNNQFAEFFNDLTKTLEIEDIQQLTMIDYLWNLCNSYQSMFTNTETITNSLYKDKNYIETNISVLDYLSHCAINEDNTAKIENYNDIRIKTERIYKCRFNELLFDLDLDYLKSILSKFRIAMPDINELSHKDFLEKIYYISDVVLPKKQAENIKEIEIVDGSEKELLTTIEKNYINRIIKQIRLQAAFIIDIFKEMSDNSSGKITKSQVLQLLYLYELHCGALKQADKMIFIDEGQDYSNFEYELLRFALGDNAVFNIYGDLKQSIDSINGITNWDNISFGCEFKKFELSENYRNTIEITNFVNESLVTKMSPIGINGARPQYIDYSETQKICNNILKQDIDTRIAFISKEKDTLRYIQNKEKIFFIGDVKESKGLEFDVVFVYDKFMSQNEKYISYTRALSKLYIIR